MKRVRRARTAPEELLARALRAAGIAYRRNVRTLPGSPDFANKRRRWAIFVMGCFWHRHTNCPRATVPTRNRPFWEAKFRDNRRRDAAKIRSLRRAGFTVLLAWECAIERDAGAVAQRLRARIEHRSRVSAGGRAAAHR